MLDGCVCPAIQRPLHRPIQPRPPEPQLPLAHPLAAAGLLLPYILTRNLHLSTQATFTLTTSITIIVYFAVQQKNHIIKRLNCFLIGGSFLLPPVILLPTVFYLGNGPCSEDGIYFNCVCRNRTLGYWIFVVNWVLPCGGLAGVTFWLMWRIRKYRVPTKLYDSLKPSMKLALLMYNIPPWNFVIFLVNLGLTFLPDFES